MSNDDLESALKKARESLRSFETSEDKHIEKVEKDSTRLINEIDKLGTSLPDKRKIAYYLLDEARTELKAVGESREDQQLSELALANKKREKQYLVNITTVALEKFKA